MKRKLEGQKKGSDGRRGVDWGDERKKEEPFLHPVWHIMMLIARWRPEFLCARAQCTLSPHVNPPSTSNMVFLTGVGGGF